VLKLDHHPEQRVPADPDCPYNYRKEASKIELHTTLKIFYVHAVCSKRVGLKPASFTQ
jgi:hypothetical protein